MPKNPALSIYESTFAQSDKTDAILIVEGKKLHVSKAVLSFHSDYFDALFNADFMEKSMPEISIEDVNFEDFAAVLSLILKNPISPTEENAEKLLELSDRFLLPAAKRHVEFFLISAGFGAFKKLEIASKYDSDTLLTHALGLFKTKEELVPTEEFSGFSEKVKSKILDRLIELNKSGLTGPELCGSKIFEKGRRKKEEGSNFLKREEGRRKKEVEGRNSAQLWTGPSEFGSSSFVGFRRSRASWSLRDSTSEREF